MDIQKLFKSSYFSWTLKILGALIILLLVFQAGIFVGFHKARFSFQWGDNYHRTFGGPRGGFLRDIQGRDFTSGHGVAGSIAQINNGSIVIKGTDGVEKNILISNQTSIRKGITNLAITELEIDEQVVVIGVPTQDGTIDAKIIRVFDAGSKLPFPGHRGNSPQ